MGSDNFWLYLISLLVAAGLATEFLPAYLRYKEAALKAKNGKDKEA